MTCSYHTVEYEWERDDTIVTIEIGYSWSRPVPASYLDPAEGGTEVTGVTAVSIRWDDDPGRVATPDELRDAELAFPSDKAFWIASGDHAAREDDARESAAEARAERLAELKSERY